MTGWKSWVWVVAVLFVAGEVRADENARPGELKVLDRWLGDWDMEVTVKPGVFFPQGSKSTFKSSIKWDINDRFLRCDAQGEGTDGKRKFKDAFMWLASYDPQAKAYTSTVFWANVSVGQGPEAWGGGDRGVGTWDEDAKTLTIRVVIPQAGLTQVSVTKWIDADTHEYTSTMTDANGNVMMEMAGKSKRRK